MVGSATDPTQRARELLESSTRTLVDSLCQPRLETVSAPAAEQSFEEWQREVIAAAAAKQHRRQQGRVQASAATHAQWDAWARKIARAEAEGVGLLTARTIAKQVRPILAATEGRIGTLEAQNKTLLERVERLERLELAARPPLRAVGDGR